MGLKANLRVKLYADDNFVAEIDNAPLLLWQQLLAHSEGMSREDSVPSQAAPAPAMFPKVVSSGSSVDNTEQAIEHSTQPSTNAIAKLAEDIGVSQDTVTSAFEPSDSAPYIALEHKYWEAFRNNAPKKGKSAIPPVAVAATLLALWKLHAKKDFPLNIALIGNVLNNINVDNKNAHRSLNNCDWLKIRQDGEIVIIPDNANKARALAKAFCTKQPIQNATNA